ncbi:MAG TPA: hypothetical protein VFA00_16005 [Actinomycetota bacterium]|jgi:hypothetical protein|nr:hypothetical protein [Actinomycetota bacterium]
MTDSIQGEMRMLATRRSIRMLVPLGAALVVSTVLAAPATGAPSDYVRMSDGTPIAINVNRALDRSSSDRLLDGTIYRPHRPHTNPTLTEPAKTYKYLVEVSRSVTYFDPATVWC